MKSTSSSEARKEKASKVSSISSTTSKLHKVAKTFTKTSSSLKKMRNLTKTPGFKHTTRSSGSCKKIVICQDNLDVQKATCSSTLKDAKFPTYLKLKRGATEAEGNSVFKVCPFNYCSLNGHHHLSAPPLKRFLSSRRKLLKSVKYQSELLSPCKVISSECNKANQESDQKNDLFMKQEVSDSLSDGLCSDTEVQDNIDQVEATCLSDKDFSPENQGYLQTPVEKQKSFQSFCVSLDDSFGEISDIEWEEGQSIAMYDMGEDFVQTDYHYLDKPEFESYKNSVGHLEFRAEEYAPYFHDEIVECLHFSDTDSSLHSESNHTGDELADCMYFEPSNKITGGFDLIYEATVNAAKQEEESIDKQGGIVSDTLKGITELQNEEHVSNQNIVESDEECYIIEEIREEEDAAEFVMEESELSEETSNEAGNCIHGRSTNSDNEEDSNTSSIHFNENNDAQVRILRMKDLRKNEKAADVSPIIGNDKQEATKCDSNKMKRSLRCRKADEETEEEKQFNPREPNFLAARHEPEAEKVDLRPQEMDERRNAEEWMLDYALQKTVNQLAPARKRKVALLVEAFESVLPISRFEWKRRSPPGFAHARTLQACS
ncbi:Calmodulin binding protein PICBP [Bienertia sinuspersici]